MAKPNKKIVGNPQSAVGNISFLSRYGWHLAIFAFAFILYSNTLHHDFVMDDGAMITNHSTVQKGFSGIPELFGQSSVYGSTKENFGTYRPLTMSLFAVEKQFFENDPHAFHFIQVLLYAVLCVMLFMLLKKIFANTLPLLPIVSTLLFVAHPIHTEVVANIKSADEILSLFFCVCALWHAIRFIETSTWKQALISWLCFLCALFSKESAATFLLIIPLALYFFTTSSRKNIFKITGILFSALAVYLLARNAALDKAPDGIGIINNSIAGAHSFSERYATILVILHNYLKLLILPHPLSWDYGYNQIRIVGLGDPVAIISLLVYMAMGVYAIIFLIRNLKSPLPPFTRGRSTAVISFCILFYLISLSVSSNIFVLIGATMAERFLFTPSLAFCILLAFALIKLLKIESLNIKLIPLGIILGLYSFKTYSRNADWKDNLTLFAKGVEVCPSSYRTNVTYAWESVLAGQKEQDPEKKKQYMTNAVTYYQKGLGIYDEVQADWYNYGVSLSNLGKGDEAISAYKRTLELKPVHLSAAYNLATIYLGKNDHANSLKYFLMAYESDSTFMDVAFKIGVNYQMMGNVSASIPYYESHFRRNPNDKNVITNLMIAYKALCNTEKTNYFMSLLTRTK